MCVGLFNLVQFTCLLYIYICLDLQKVPPGFFSDCLICGLFGTRPCFFSYDVFSTKKKNLTSCIRQKNKTKQNKTNKTTQKTNKQTKNMRSYVTAHVLYDPSKSYTAYEHSRCGLA